MARIKGLDALRKTLSNFRQNAEKEAKTAMQEAVSKMITDAKSYAPRDLFNLVNSIDKEDRDNGWTVVFFVGEAHGAFMEFGTGPRVDVPPELSAVAADFKGYKSGSFDEFVGNIREWCARKGIDTDAAYVIALSILNKGLAPRPYFYPAYLKYRGTILPDIEDRMQKLLR